MKIDDPEEYIEQLFDKWFSRKNRSYRTFEKLRKLSKELNVNQYFEELSKENMTFREYYDLTVKDLVWIQKWFMMYASDSVLFGKFSGDHYFLKHILEDDCLEWHEWEKKISSKLKYWIEARFKRLMVTDDYYSQNKNVYANELRNYTNSNKIQTF